MNQNDQTLSSEHYIFTLPGVVSISWYPAGLADQQGKPSDDLMPTYLDAAQKYGLKVCSTFKIIFILARHLHA